MGRPAADAPLMPDPWKIRAEQKREARGMTRSALAAAVGTTAGNITRCLAPVSQGGYRSSTFAPKIAEVLGEPLPGVHDEGVRVISEMLAEIRLLSPAIYETKERDLRSTLKELRRLLHPKK